MISELELESLRKKVDRQVLELKTAETSLEKEKEKLEAAEDRILVAEEAQHVAQKVAQGIQQMVHKQVAGVVSRCLQTVFDEPYAFFIHFEQKRGRTEARMVFSRNGVEVDPLSASGGGVVDVAAFALRLSCLCLSKPKRRHLLVLDEPFKFVSEEYRHRIRGMMEKLSEEMGVQIIMVTHIKELETGKVIRL